MNNINTLSIFKKNIILIVCAFTLLIYGCASENEEFIGYGKVTTEKKLDGPDYKPKESTVVGGLAGAGSGAVIGGVTGAVAMGAASAAAAVPSMGIMIVAAPAMILMGAGIGAASGAVIGGAIGAGGGYVYGLNEQGLGVFEFNVQPKKAGSDPVIVRQNIKEQINVGEMVKIYKDRKDGFYPLGYHIEVV